MAGALSGIKRLYLSLYNWAVFVGWFQVLVLALKTLKESGHQNVYDAVEKPLQLAQTAAVLEILHGLGGLVRSPITATLPQIGSRLFVTWGILYSFPEIRTHVLVSFLVISWSITEVFTEFAQQQCPYSRGKFTGSLAVQSLFYYVPSFDVRMPLLQVFTEPHFDIIRYSFYGVKESLGFTPSWLLWLRYSTFMLLYPTGITSEVGLIYLSLPYIKNSEKFCVRMPNKLNFSFDYFYAAILVLGVYVPGSPHMYNYMLGQRKKALAKSKRE